MTLDPGELQESLDLGPFLQVYQPRYNISPTQPIAIVRDSETKAIELFRWGLVPSWAKDIAIGSKMINARSETISEKSSFRNAFKKRRCLILADGFFEWTALEPGKGKTPFYFQVDQGKAFTFAGLYEFWHSPEGDQLPTCTIITCEPNNLLKTYHNRMPVILSEENRWNWLNLHSDQDSLKKMLSPISESRMSVRQVSKAINSPLSDSPEILLQ
ncbi:MAG: SOS response-associated peptidase [Anaerolineaceae bacterium]|nr:SOS response-associated peptidase [Anaerolineaceae bacterium]